MNCLYCEHKFNCVLSRYNPYDVTQSSTVLCPMYKEVKGVFYEPPQKKRRKK